MDASASGGARQAPPALVVAVAVGLASMDMPIPNVSTWDWASWKFPRPVRAGDTLYARWTLTQKRAPVRGSKTSIAVWRVDVHTADGTICAEGEVGASVFRSAAPAQAPSHEPATAAANGPTPRRRRRKRGGATEAAAPATQPAAPPAPAPQQQATEPRTGGRRRRRRRSSGGGASNENHVLPPASEPALPEPVAASAPAPQSTRAAANPLSRVMKRLRGT